MSSSGFWKGCWPEPTKTSRIAAALLAAILVLQPSLPAGAQPTVCGSYAVAVAPQPAGHPLSDNVVRLVDSSGETARFAVAQPGNVMPSSRNGVAIVRSLGGIFSLLDLKSGSSTPVQIPEDEQPLISFDLPAYRNAASANCMIFPTGPTSVWLVDLGSGQAIDLVTVTPNDGLIESAAIAPGGKWAAFFSKDAGYLISLETPGDPILISTDPVLPFPGFTSDGRALIFATRSETGVTVSTRDLASGITSNIGETPSANYLDATSSARPLLIDAQSLLQLPANSEKPENIFTWQGATLGIIGDSTGRYLLVGDDRRDGSAVWSWIDTATGSVVELDALTDMTPLRIGDRQDAVTFLLSAQQGPGTPGAAYRTVDLATGHISTALTQDSPEVWMDTPGGDTAGRYTLVDAVSPGQGRMWLIDAEDGTSSQVGSSPGNLAARVSPDGCQLAVAVFNTIGEGRTSVVTVTSLIDGTSVATIPDSILLGWTKTTPAA